MRVLALATNLEGAAFRYRIGQFVAPLAGLGITVEPQVLPRRRGARKRLFLSAGEFDLVWLLRRTLAWTDRRLLRRWTRRLVFDFDDAVWMRDSNRLIRASFRRARRFRRTVRAADLVLAGNEYLAGEARRFASAVQVLPTCVIVERYRPRRDHPPADPLELVWIGQRSTLGYLQEILPALDDLAEKRPARLTVISDVFPHSRRIEVRRVAWSAETEAAELGKAHVGLAPLADDRWSRGKCGLKVLQYMAAGLPVVASPVGVQVEMIGGTSRGRLAGTRREWVEHLAALGDDPGERERCGHAARALVEAQYSVTRWAPPLAWAFEALARREVSAR